MVIADYDNDNKLCFVDVFGSDTVLVCVSLFVWSVFVAYRCGVVPFGLSIVFVSFFCLIFCLFVQG